MRRKSWQALTVEADVVSDLICNRCGESMAAPFRGGILADRHSEREYLGLIDGVVDGCYASTHLVDTHRYRFELCESCVRDLFCGFKVPPAITEISLATAEDTGETVSWEEDRRIRDDMDNVADPLERWECSCEEPIRVTVGARRVHWHRNGLWSPQYTRENAGRVEMHLECMALVGRGNNENEAYKALDTLFRTELEMARVIDLGGYLRPPHWRVERRPEGGWP
jgi:hypothetical protein